MTWLECLYYTSYMKYFFLIYENQSKISDMKQPSTWFVYIYMSRLSIVESVLIGNVLKWVWGSFYFPPKPRFAVIHSFWGLCMCSSTLMTVTLGLLLHTITTFTYGDISSNTPHCAIKIFQWFVNTHRVQLEFYQFFFTC